MALLSSPMHIISSTPPATRIFTILLLALSLFNFYIRFISTGPQEPMLEFLLYFTPVPGHVLYYPWTLLTGGFVEQNLVELLVALFFLPASLRYLERLWGAIETIKFILITLTVSNFISVAFNWIVWAATGSERFLYGMDYHGTMALQTGILVAFTQLIPEHQVQFFGILSVRVKRLPMFYVGVSNVFCILGDQSPWFLIQIGWLVSWAYLRFYKRSTDALSGLSTYGDRSETFAFIQWFPPVVHKPLSALSTATHNLAVKLRLIRPFSLGAGDLEAGVYSALPVTGGHGHAGGARAEAERRRALALKALDQRLASTSTTTQPGASSAPPNARTSTSTANAPTSVKVSSSSSGNGISSTIQSPPQAPAAVSSAPSPSIPEVKEEKGKESPSS